MPDQPIEDIVELPANFTGEEPTTPATPAEPSAPIVPVVEPTKPEPVDIDTLRAQMKAEIIAEIAASNKPAEPAKPADEFDKLQEMFFDNPAEALRQAASIGAQMAVQETMARVTPYMSRAAATDVIDKVAGDLGPEAKAYISKIAPQIDPSQLKGDALDIIRSAAMYKDHEAKLAAENRRQVEPAHSESPTVRVDQQAFAQANAERKSLGVKPLTASEFAELMTV